MKKGKVPYSRRKFLKCGSKEFLEDHGFHWVEMSSHWAKIGIDTSDVLNDEEDYENYLEFLKLRKTKLYRILNDEQ